MAETGMRPTPGEGLRLRFPALARLGGAHRRRVPHVQQMTPADCGAACLTMVLRHHGLECGLDEVRRALGTGGRGTDASSLLEVGRSYGLRGRGVQIERIEDLETLERGAVLHWRFDHFVVLEAMDHQGAVVLDPARGRHRVTRRELDTAVTGVALCFTPTPSFEPKKGGESRGLVRRVYLACLLSRGATLGRILGLSLLLQLLALAVPVATGLLVDRVVPHGDRGLLLTVGAGIAAVALFHLLSSLIRSHLLLELRTRLDAELTLGFLDHMVDLPFEFFQERPTGDLMMRLNSNSSIRETLTAGTLTTLLDGALVGLYLGILLLGHPGLAILVLALGLARISVYLLTRRRHRELVTESLEAQAASRSFQVELLGAISTLKAMGAEERAVQRWSDLFVGELNVVLRRGRLKAGIDAVLACLSIASPLLVLAAGAWLVLAGELSLGAMLALSAVGVAFLTPLSTLVSTAIHLQLLGSYFERIEDVLTAPREQTGGDRMRPEAIEGRLEVERLGFCYQPGGPPAVEDVSVVVEPGSFVAIVGRSGAGKSTLARLLLGLHRPTRGRVLLDGHELGALDLRWVRRRIGVVSQEPHLFGASIRENVALTDPSVPLERVVEAARKARIHDEIAALPMGYDTVLADRGESLSGGQRQRLAIARALVHRPSILLLDEATSHLDAVTEREIQSELRRLRCTRVVVAHRLSTVAAADLILVMDRGRLVERGRHAELLEAGGLYAELASSQLEPETPRPHLDPVEATP